MFRLLFRLLLLLLAIGFIRYVIRTVSRVLSQDINPSSAARTGQTPGAATSGELKQDPVCGTFVSASTSVKKTVNGELVHFCSVTCRDKFKVA
jgi:YHS domain-containing protein